MHTPEKAPANDGERKQSAARGPRLPAMTPAAAAAGPMSPAAVLTLQRAIGNRAVARALAHDEHVHGADCGHGPVQRRAAVDTSDAPAEILKAALASENLPIETSTLRKAQSVYQNDRLSLGRVHTGPLAQRAVEAFGAKAMTVDTHIFFGAGAEHDTATAFHEFGHLDKNTRGIAESGTDNGGGVPVTDPNQSSERTAATDGAAAARGAEVAPSVAQRAVDQGAAMGAGPGAGPADAVQRVTVQRMENQRRHRRRSGDEYEADASGSPSSAGTSPERREMRRRVEEANLDLGGLQDRLAGLQDIQPFRRMPPRVPTGDTPESLSPELSESSTSSESPERPPELPENEKLTPLHDLLMEELNKPGGVNRKMKVTFKVAEGTANPFASMGHSWIEISGSAGSTTVGYFPAARDGIPLFQSVPGGVHCPDPVARYGRPTQYEEKRRPLKDIIRGYHLINEQSQADYNWTLNNCTTFATSVWKTITGKEIPHEWLTLYGLLSTAIATPHGAGEGLQAHQERRHERRIDETAPRFEGVMGATLFPGPGTPRQKAERKVRGKYHQSSSSDERSKRDRSRRDSDSVD